MIRLTAHKTLNQLGSSPGIVNNDVGPATLTELNWPDRSRISYGDCVSFNFPPSHFSKLWAVNGSSLVGNIKLMDLVTFSFTVLKYSLFTVYFKLLLEPYINRPLKISKQSVCHFLSHITPQKSVKESHIDFVFQNSIDCVLNNRKISIFQFAIETFCFLLWSNVIVIECYSYKNGDKLYYQMLTGSKRLVHVMTYNGYVYLFSKEVNVFLSDQYDNFVASKRQNTGRRGVLIPNVSTIKSSISNSLLTIGYG